jgi:hypothetical protein
MAKRLVDSLFSIPPGLIFNSDWLLREGPSSVAGMSDGRRGRLGKLVLEADETDGKFGKRLVLEVDEADGMIS